MRARGPAQRHRHSAPAASPPLPLRHPAALSVALVAAGCIALSVTMRIFDTDFWHHLLVGRVIWQTHSIPTRQLWSWPTYGIADANNAWLFRALIWPLWAAWGTWGLFAWRWASTLVVFGVSWATARRMGASGLTPWVVLVTCALVYRQRSQVRPETLVAVLMALQIWVLEARRRAREARASTPTGAEPHADAKGAADPTLWLIPIAWVWANAHPSYYMGFILIAFHLVDDLWPQRGARGADRARRLAATRRLVAIAGAALAISFVNPWGWRALWQPLEFFFTLRHEPIYKTIGELQPLDWHNNDRNGLFVILALWPVLALWRWRRQGLDLVEAASILFFTALMLNTQRFTGAWSVVAAPYLARDLHDWIASRRWPAWTRQAWTRAALTAATCVVICIPDWRRVEYPLGVGLDMARYPVVACDFMAAHAVRGRGFNDFFQGGYQAWRFWPERERLPFMTGTPEVATPTDRNLMVLARQDPQAWRRLDTMHHFDYALVSRFQSGWGRLMDFIDVDSTWALVFADDAAALYVRRGGPLDSIAVGYAYRWLPGGTERLEPLGRAALTDTVLRAGLRSELLRETRESTYNSQAFSLLAREAFNAQRLDEARTYTEASLRAEPTTPGEHERLGVIALAQSRPSDALEEFKRERELLTTGAGLDLRFGQAYAALGESGRARGFLLRALEHDPSNQEARAALAGLNAGKR